MQAVILAGGLGTRLAEETQIKPKPMVEIGGQPILWHIMMIYSHFGIHDFIICLGYKGYVIKEYFANFVLHRSDVKINLSRGRVDYLGNNYLPPWSVTLVDTGAESMTGGRLRRIGHLLSPNEPFCMTYGDGLADLDISALIAFHKRGGHEATLTAVRPPSRYGVVVTEGDRVVRFAEKPSDEGARINAGFFVLEPSVIQRIAGDSTVWEKEPLEGLARDGQLDAFKHDGFWQPMDTLRDKNYLEELWQKGNAPWKIWK
ncbi:glucose-1-phosphate cytidylyltransferase [Pseudacidobacterium ailaaui]|uniref:glucose-1-phosphate cytidylyltransferase n=1 Tax=Pseudacidobacterium ailaaui TaxID=1382359 RepID=UPI00047DAF35|nr:glucose-1-phosphate cytidylyltransferase [Pseudacidobacterium ailaaui]